ncbi:MAG: NERD domain-containing protein [Chloroflexi bacterium]|nr:NERD domain-containing protein [Chloroflexota bacterium]
MLDSFQTFELEERDRFGAGGEDEVERILRRGGWKFLRNALAPHPTRVDRFLETDFVVHIGSSLVALEVKRLVGRITFADQQRRAIRQLKLGCNGQSFVTKEFQNPMLQAKHAAVRLKQFLAEVDPWFASARIDPAVVFARTADISAIRDSTRFMYVSELSDFLKRRADTPGGRDKPWLVDAFMYIPTWDRVETHAGDSIYGLFTDAALHFVDALGQNWTMPFRHIAEVRLEQGGFLADGVEATIRTTQRDVLHTRIALGHVVLDHFGSVQCHKLRNLRRILPGVARLRRHAPLDVIDQPLKMRGVPPVVVGRQ